LKLTNSKTVNEKIEASVLSVISRGNSKPRKVETLTNMISALFIKAIDEEELDTLIKELLRKKYITIQNGKVHYQLTQ
jgi:BRCT domain type II-containing protein